MPLRIEPLPRMAGHLSFMRARCAGLDALGPGMVAAFGAPCDGAAATGLAPLALRETSAYFGSHFSANMKAAMDIDQRRQLDGSKLAGCILDLGDLPLSGTLSAYETATTALVAEIARRGAIPLMLGGDERLVPVAVAGLARSGDTQLALLRIGGASDLAGASLPAGTIVVDVAVGAGSSFTTASLPGDRERPTTQILSALAGRRVHVALDLAGIASPWHGASVSAGFDGLSLGAARALLRAVGALDVAGLSITGLDPTVNGISTVKTGQRLLLTAMLDLVYARLGVFQPLREALHV